MAHRTILTKRQRADLFDLPTDESSLLHHYTLADDDIEHIHERRRPENRIGFALQLCALRYPGRILLQGEIIPEKVLHFIGAQLGISGEAPLSYAARRQTRQQHLEAFRNIYGYKMFFGRGARDLKIWLVNEAEVARSRRACCMDRAEGEISPFPPVQLTCLNCARPSAFIWFNAFTAMRVSVI